MKNNRRNKTTLNDEVIEVLDRISKCAKRYGFPAIINKLKQLDVDSEETNSVFDFVFTVVQERYGVSRKDLVGMKRGSVSEARKVCLILLDNHTSLSANSITTYFDNRSKTVLFQVKKEYEHIDKNPVTSEEKQFLLAFKELDIKVAEFKKSTTPNEKTKS